MLKLIREYTKSNPAIQFFTANWLLYAIVMLITTVYCYARLDFARSYKTPPPIIENTPPTTETKK